MNRSLQALLEQARKQKASDIHISENAPVSFRVHGKLITEGEALTQDEVRSLFLGLTSQYQEPEKTEAKAHTSLPETQLQQTLDSHGSVDFGYTCEQGHRYRINAYQCLGSLAIALRHLNNNFQSLSDLHLPRAIENLTETLSGLVLVCGATGSGKSTTLASLIHDIAHKRPVHIITIEDPVEFIHRPSKAVIHQREMGRDFTEFPHAVRAALREDPDVLMVGEMRDLETIRAALTAAETGHLVFSTLHTNDAVSSIERLIGAFPGNEQDLARVRLSRCLRAVVAQHLLPTSNGLGRVPAVEVLLKNSAVSNLIENDKTRQLYSTIESNRSQGMQTLDQSLADLVSNRWISLELAQSYARQPNTLKELVAQVGGQSSVYQ